MTDSLTDPRRGRAHLVRQAFRSPATPPPSPAFGITWSTSAAGRNVYCVSRWNSRRTFAREQLLALIRQQEQLAS